MTIHQKLTMHVAKKTLNAHANEDFVSRNDARTIAQSIEQFFFNPETPEGPFDVLMAEILNEVQRAEKKHPEWPDDIIHRVAIVAEESGEAVRAALNYHYESGPMDEVKKELIQTAATCIRMLKSIL